MEGKNYVRPKEQVRAARIFHTIQICCVLAAFGLLFVDWWCTVVAAGVLLWNDYFYSSGCQSQVVDEYERGYPTDGLRRMYKSWRWLAVCLVILYFLVFKN